MNAHLALERLSALVDGELPWTDRRSVEEHLQACPGCRTRLAGLAEVAARLRALQREAPPRALDLLVARPRPLRPAGRRGGPLRAASTVPPLFLPFAVVVALTVYLASFAGFLDRNDPASAVTNAELVLGAAASEDPAAEPRRFRHEGGIWRETGPETPSRAASAEEQAAVLAELPALARVLSSGAVEVCWRGERIRLAARAATPHAGR